MLETWDAKYPNRSEIMFTALKNISPTHMFDTDLYDFKNLQSKLVGVTKVGAEFEML